jgi:hypothetical protein
VHHEQPKEARWPFEKGDSRKTGLAVANFAGTIIRIFLGTVLQTEEKLQEKLLEVSA